MVATSKDAPGATPTLNFDVIDTRAEALHIHGKAALASYLGVDVTTLWRWRKGIVAPQLATVREIAALLGVSVADLMPETVA